MGSQEKNFYAELADRLAAYAGAGVDTLAAFPCGPDRPAIVRAPAEATVGSRV